MKAADAQPGDEVDHRLQHHREQRAHVEQQQHTAQQPRQVADEGDGKGEHDVAAGSAPRLGFRAGRQNDSAVLLNYSPPLRMEPTIPPMSPAPAVCGTSRLPDGRYSPI